MSIGAVNGANGIQADLAETLLNGPMQMAEQEMKVAKVAMQTQLKEQEMAQVQNVVAQMTGVGGMVNTVA